MESHTICGSLVCGMCNTVNKTEDSKYLSETHTESFDGWIGLNYGILCKVMLVQHLYTPRPQKKKTASRPLICKKMCYISSWPQLWH